MSTTTENKPIGIVFVAVEEDWYSTEGIDMMKASVQWCEAAHLDRAFARASDKYSAAFQRGNTNIAAGEVRADMLAMVKAVHQANSAGGAGGNAAATQGRSSSKAAANAAHAEPMHPLFGIDGAAFFYPALSPDPPYFPRLPDPPAAAAPSSSAADSPRDGAGSQKPSTPPGGSGRRGGGGTNAAAADAEPPKPPATVQQLVDAYMPELEAFCHADDDKCSAHGVRYVFAPLLHPRLIAALRAREAAGYSDMYLAHILVVQLEVPQDVYTAPLPGFPPGKEAVLVPPALAGGGGGGRSGGGGASQSSAALLMASPAALAAARNSGRTPRSGRGGAGGGKNAKDKAIEPAFLLPPECQLVMSTAVEQALTAAAAAEQQDKSTLPSTSYVEHKHGEDLLSTFVLALEEVQQELDSLWDNIEYTLDEDEEGGDDEDGEEQQQQQQHQDLISNTSGSTGGAFGAQLAAVRSDSPQDPLDMPSPLATAAAAAAARKSKTARPRALRNTSSVDIPLVCVPGAPAKGKQQQQQQFVTSDVVVPVLQQNDASSCMFEVFSHVTSTLNSRAVERSAALVQPVTTKSQLVDPSQLAAAAAAGEAAGAPVAAASNNGAAVPSTAAGASTTGGAMSGTSTFSGTGNSSSNNNMRATATPASDTMGSSYMSNSDAPAAAAVEQQLEEEDESQQQEQQLQSQRQQQRVPFVYHELAAEKLLVEPRPEVAELSKSDIAGMLSSVAPWCPPPPQTRATTTTTTSTNTAKSSSKDDPAAAAAAAAMMAPPEVTRTGLPPPRKNFLRNNGSGVVSEPRSLGEARFVSCWCASAAAERRSQMEANSRTPVPPPASAFDLLAHVCSGSGDELNQNQSTMLSRKHVESVSRWVTPIERSHVLSQALLDAEVEHVVATTSSSNSRRSSSSGSSTAAAVSGTHPFVQRLSASEAWAAAMDAEAASLFPAQTSLNVIELQDGPKVQSLFAPQAAESTASARLAAAAASGALTDQERERALFLLHHKMNASGSNNNNNNNNMSMSTIAAKPEQLPTPIALLLVRHREPAHRVFATGFGPAPGVMQLRECAEVAESDESEELVAGFARWVLDKFNGHWSVGSRLSPQQALVAGAALEQHQKLLAEEAAAAASNSARRAQQQQQRPSSGTSKRGDTPTRGGRGAATAAAAGTKGRATGKDAAAAALEEALAAARAAAPRLSTAQRLAATGCVLRDLSLVAEETLEVHPSDGSALGISITSPAVGSHRAVWAKDDVLVTLACEQKNGGDDDNNSTTTTRFVSSFLDGGVLTIDKAAGAEPLDYSLLFQRDGCVLRWKCAAPAGSDKLTPSSSLNFVFSGSSNSSSNSISVAYVDPATGAIEVDSFVEVARRVEAATATVEFDAVLRNCCGGKAGNAESAGVAENSSSNAALLPPSPSTGARNKSVKISLHPDGKMVVVFVDASSCAKSCLVTLANGRRYSSVVAARRSDDGASPNRTPTPTASPRESGAAAAAATAVPSLNASVNATTAAAAADVNNIAFSAFTALSAVASTARFDMQHGSNMTCNAALSSSVNIVGSRDTVASFGICGVNIATAYLADGSVKHQLSFGEDACPGIVISKQQTATVVSANFRDGTVICSGERSSSSSADSTSSELSRHKCFSIYRPSGSSTVLDADSGLIFVTPSSLRVDTPSLHHAALAANVLVVDLETRTLQLVEQYQPFVTRVTLPGGTHCAGDMDNDNSGDDLSPAPAGASATDAAPTSGSGDQGLGPLTWRPDALLYPRLPQFDSCVVVRRYFDAEEELIRFSGQGCVVPPSGKINGGDRDRIRLEQERARAVVGMPLSALVDGAAAAAAAMLATAPTLQDKLLRVTVPFIGGHRLIEYETVRQRIARNRSLVPQQQQQQQQQQRVQALGTRNASVVSTGSVVRNTAGGFSRVPAHIDGGALRARFPHITNATMPRVIDDLCSLLAPPQPPLQLYVIYNDGHAQRHLTSREALQELLQRSCVVPLPQVSASRAAVAGEDAVEKWVFAFRFPAAAESAAAGAGEQSGGDALAPTTQLWSGVPPPLAASPQLLLPQDFRPSTFAANQVTTTTTTATTTGTAASHEKKKSSSTIWSLTRYQPIADEARAAIIDDAVRSQLARERAASYRLASQLIPDPDIARQIEQSREAGNALLDAKEQEVLAAMQQRLEEQQQSEREQQQQQQQQRRVVAATTIRREPRIPTPTQAVRWTNVRLSEDVVDFERLLPGFRFLKAVTLVNGGASPVSFTVERTTGTTTLRADAIAEARLVHPPPPLSATSSKSSGDPASSSSASSVPAAAIGASAAVLTARPTATRFVQVQNQRGNVHPGDSVRINFVVDARAPRRIADSFFVHLDAPAGPALAVTVRAEIVKGGPTSGGAALDGAKMLSSSVKVLGKTLM